MDPKFLTENGWRAVVSKYKIKDNGLQRSLAAYQGFKEEKYDERLRFIASVAQLATALKKSKELAAHADAVKYLTDVVDAADEQKTEIGKAKTEADKMIRVGVTFEHPWEKDFRKWQTQFATGELKIKGKIAGELVPKGSGRKVTEGYTTEKGVKGAVELAKSEAAKRLGLIEFEVEATLEHEISAKKFEISVQARFTFKKVAWFSPILNGEFVIFGAEWEKKSKFSVAKFAVAGGAKCEGKFELNEHSEVSVVVEFMVEGSAQPNWTEIGKKVAKPIAEKAARGFAVAVESLLTFEMLVVSGLAAFSTAIIAGTLKSLVEGCEIRGLDDLVQRTARAFALGFVAGITGERPPSNQLSRPGYEMGKKNFLECKKAAMAKCPEITDEDLQARIKEELRGMWDGLFKLMIPYAQQAVWDGFGAAHIGWWNRNIDGSTIKNGYLAIYRKAGSESDSNFAKYYKH